MLDNVWRGHVYVGHEGSHGYLILCESASCPNGKYVHSFDYDALLAHIEVLKAELAGCQREARMALFVDDEGKAAGT